MRFLLSPKWVIGHIVVLAVGITCISLGFWQLDRLEQRRLENAVRSARYTSDPQPIQALLAGADDDLGSLEFRRATATGRFVPEDELLLRSQVRQGRAGYEVVTPLEISGGPTVLVNRGWVPLEMDTVPVEAAPPPTGEVTVQGIVRPSRERQGFGPVDSTDTEDDVVSRIDIELVETRLARRLASVYLEVVGEGSPTELPIPAAAPELDDEGPHLSYAIQWFSFALVGIVGYGLLIRQSIRKPPGTDQPRSEP